MSAIFENKFDLSDFSFTSALEKGYKQLHDALKDFKYPIFSEENIMIQGGCSCFNTEPIKPLIKKAVHCKPK